MESNVTLSDLIQTLVDHSRGKAMTHRTADTGRLVTREDVRRVITDDLLEAAYVEGWTAEEFVAELSRALGIQEFESSES